MAHQQSAELAEPGVGSLDDPATLVAAQFAPIFVTPMLVVLPLRRKQLDTASSVAPAVGPSRRPGRQSRVSAVAADDP